MIDCSDRKLQECIRPALLGYKAGIYEWNMIDNSAYYSKEWKKMLGYCDDDIAPHLSSWKNLAHPDDLEKVLLDVKKAVTLKKNRVEAIHRVKHKNGTWVWILGRGLIEYKDDKPVKMVGIHTDITEQKNRELEAKYLAYHDPLTKIPNRILFEDRLNQSILKSKRENLKTALFFIDLDNFKNINDSLGHDVGDIILKKITSRLSNAIRKNDTVARVGGDEFTIIMDGIKNKQSVSMLMKKILSLTKDSISVCNKKINVSYSVGVSIYPDDTKSTEQMIKYADIAMYEAKNCRDSDYKYY